MDVEELRSYALAKEGTQESMPFGPNVLVIKVFGKMFLLIALDEFPPTVNAKCNPERAISLREEYPKHILPGYHMNKLHWNTIVSDGTLPKLLLKELLDHSYELVYNAVPASKRKLQ